MSCRLILRSSITDFKELTTYLKDGQESQMCPQGEDQNKETRHGKYLLLLCCSYNIEVLEEIEEGIKLYFN